MSAEKSKPQPDPDVVLAAVEYGEQLYREGYTQFSKWSKKMIAGAGEEVRPYLDAAWKRVTAMYGAEDHHTTSEAHSFSKVPRWALIIAMVIVAISGAIFSFTVWPTIYRYDHINMTGGSLPVRQNRITGRTEILFPGGWEDAVKEEGREIHEREMNQSELEKLEVRPRLGYSSTGSQGWDEIEANVYNGLQAVTVSEITIEITVSDAQRNPIIISRRYRLRGGRAAPFQTGYFSATLGFDILPNQTWSYKLVAAKAQTN